MNIQHTRNGSALVIVMLLMTVIMVCIANTWHTTFYATDIARKRQCCEQRLRATEGLINYAVALCKDNWQELVTQKAQEGTLSTVQWPCGDGQLYAGTVTIKLNNKSEALLKAQLIDHGTVICTLGCVVRSREDEQGVAALSVEGWHFEAS